jgi:CheY-like chemotaxis protein
LSLTGRLGILDRVAAHASSHRPRSGMKVLVVDDEPEVRAAVSEFLAFNDMEVLEAANGLEALLQVKRERPDAVVLDLRMPRLGGIDALKRIRTLDPSIAVVVVTGDIDEDVHRQAMALGARAVLTKPVQLPELVEVLRGGGAVPAAVPDAPAERAESPATPPATSAIRVLVVDDDRDVREMLADFLESRGYDVTTQPDAASAIRALVHSPPDAVLLDINMPGLTGEAALPTIRAVAPRVAVIMVSASGDEAIARRTLAHGAFDYIVKPVDLTYLEQSLETAVTMRGVED